jgi:hypothetical protein
MLTKFRFAFKNRTIIVNPLKTVINEFRVRTYVIYSCRIFTNGFMGDGRFIYNEYEERNDKAYLLNCSTLFLRVATLPEKCLLERRNKGLEKNMKLDTHPHSIYRCSESHACCYHTFELTYPPLLIFCGQRCRGADGKTAQKDVKNP